MQSTHHVASGRFRTACSIAPLLLFACPAAMADGLKFDFPPGKTRPGWTKVTSDSRYEEGKPFGYLHAAKPSDNEPALFAIPADEGNYQVTVRFGDPRKATSTTIKAEARRLMVEKVATAAGQYETRSFTVNVRKPEIASGGMTRLNQRETGPPVSLGWDDLLTLEFNGTSPGVASVEIEPVRKALTIFLAGDSTVTDQVNEPYAGWGQMLPRFMAPDVAVSNQAESGLALSSFHRQRRLEKILSMMQAGDYLFIQFGHNDQKDKREGAGPFTTYKKELDSFVTETRQKQGIPVLVTPMERRRFDNNGKPETTLADYAEAVRQVGAERKVPVIDLHAMSLKLYAALGPEHSKQAFVFYKAGSLAGIPQELKDNTHHNNFGGYELARCVVEGIKANLPGLAGHLAKDAGSFDPSNPDSPERLALPMSPLKQAAPPTGS